MNNRRVLIGAAISGLVAMGALTLAGAQVAQEEGKEKCYGVVKAGKNDCAGPGHTCQGQAKTDANPQEYVYVPTGTCERLVNGSLTAKAG